MNISRKSSCSSICYDQTVCPVICHQHAAAAKRPLVQKTNLSFQMYSNFPSSENLTLSNLSVVDREDSFPSKPEYFRLSFNIW